MLTDTANIHIYIHTSVSPPLPLATHITLCSLQLSYKWAHYSQQGGKLIQANPFIRFHTSEISHCILTLLTFACCSVCVSVCIYVPCSECIEQTLIRSSSASMMNESLFILWLSAWWRIAPWKPWISVFGAKDTGGGKDSFFNIKRSYLYVATTAYPPLVILNVLVFFLNFWCTHSHSCGGSALRSVFLLNALVLQLSSALFWAAANLQEKPHYLLTIKQQAGKISEQLVNSGACSS